jgi:lipopolysaccharide transport system ATP-binding protein
MSKLAIKAENISKQYRLGEVGTGTLSHDLNRFWHKVRGKEDPYLQIGQTNDRSQKADSNYVWSLKDINFEIEQGDAVGIIGRNGAGKSTLLKLLSKVTKPTTGRFHVNGRIASLLEVGTGFNPEMTGRENIYMNGAILGMRRHEITRKFDEIVAFSGVEAYIDTPVKRYSSGMYVRLAFAVAAHLESEILIVDEVLAVGDAEFQKKCLGKMGDVSKGEGRTVLFVSHNMQSVMSLCNKSIVLSNGSVIFEGGSKEGVKIYQNNNFRNNRKEFQNRIVEKIEAYQSQNDIFLSLSYKSYKELDIPNFGFVINNEFGMPVLGANPIIYNEQIKKEKSFIKGEIIAKIKDPKLINGNYSLDVWFGDSKENLFEEKDVLTFEIEDMCKLKFVNTDYIGSYRPTIEWKI